MSPTESASCSLQFGNDLFNHPRENLVAVIWIFYCNNPLSTILVAKIWHCLLCLTFTQRVWSMKLCTHDNERTCFILSNVSPVIYRRTWIRNAASCCVDREHSQWDWVPHQRHATWQLITNAILQHRNEFWDRGVVRMAGPVLMLLPFQKKHQAVLARLVLMLPPFPAIGLSKYNSLYCPWKGRRTRPPMGEVTPRMVSMYAQWHIKIGWSWIWSLKEKGWGCRVPRIYT